MKQLLLICAVVMGQSVLAQKPLTKEESAKIIEAAIRKAAKKPTGELTKADYEKVTGLILGKGQSLTPNKKQLTSLKGLEKLTKLTHLWLNDNQLTSVKELEKLTKLEILDLRNNPDLTEAQIDQLQKALPNCGISCNPKK